MKKLALILVFYISLIFAQDKVIVQPENFSYANSDTVITADFAVYDSLHVAIQFTDTVNTIVYWESSILGRVYNTDSIGAISAVTLSETGISIKPTVGIMQGRLKFIFAASGNDTQSNGLGRVFLKEFK